MNPARILSACGVLAYLALAGCSGDASDDLGTTDDALLLMNAGKPMPCADPAPISTANDEKTWFVYCTGMNHVWKTSDWTSFSDAASSLVFHFGSLNALGRNTNTWWAPSILYLPSKKTYALWVSVEDGNQASDDRRSLAVFSGPSPTGPWTFERYGKRAAANGEHHIDPGLVTGSGGAHWLYWKSYGGTAQSAINGAALGGDALAIAGEPVKLFDGYDMNGWEQHVRENPSVWENPQTGVWHMLYSGAAWADSTYATGHAFSTCGALCRSAGGWRIASAEDRGVAQVMQAKNDATFAHGGPGGAAWLGSSGNWIVFAAAARSKQGDKTRYLFRQHLTWGANHSPYVNTAKHIPSGF
ncbi:MAG TPA: family 43 glycosylhydrolase [Polyangiaceae bacterium]